jgi:hypothetical protein
MQRRNVVKGLLALPFTKLASAQTVCSNSGVCTPASNPLLVVLEGPFAIVLQKPNSSSPDVTKVLALVPVHSAHLFVLNGVPLNSNQHHFTFTGPGLAPNTQVCVDKIFKDFCVPMTNFQCNENVRFVQIAELPCPRRILARNALNVQFESGDPGCMPLDHILEYDIADPKQPTTISYKEQANQLVHPVGNIFYFEVGRDPSSPSPAAHAVSFHNGVLLPCFSPLQNDRKRRLQQVSIDQTCGGSALTEQVRNRLKIFTTTLECKSGGIIGGNP